MPLKAPVKVQHLEISETLVQECLALEVDTRVLYQELSKLVALSGRIGDSFRALRLLVQEQEFLDTSEELV